MEQDPPARGIVLSPEALSHEVLRGFVEAFATASGTDCGAVERSVEEKIARVMAQLAVGRRGSSSNRKSGAPTSRWRATWATLRALQF